MKPRAPKPAARPLNVTFIFLAVISALTVTSRRKQSQAEASRRRAELAGIEYKSIKSEQSARISTRDNLLYAVIVAVGAVIAGTHSPRAWLLVPVVALILGWNYLMNDAMISFIGRFYRHHPDLPGLRWETEHPADKHRVQRKVIQLLVDLMAFPGAGAGFLVAFWIAAGPQPVLLVVASIVEAVVMTVLAWQFVLYAVPFKPKHRTGSRP